ncbi:hypothetical protein [Dactylosporangium cerinum]
MALPGVHVEPIDLFNGVARSELDLLLREDHDGGLVGALEYDAELFDDGTARALAADYLAVLDAMARRPDDRISTLLPALRKDLP